MAEREASKIPENVSNPANRPLHKKTAPHTSLVRTKRVREARDEAKKEIAEYKAKKEDEFQKFGAEHSKGNEQAEAEAATEADKHIRTIKEAGAKGQAGVVKNLLSAVFDVTPVAPAKQ
ncbi:hypothetical protein E4U42_002892 [Claviceps africana]|uniref:V-type proton ATPase subunit G n=1 Tax=Claviceps africana TaxID=83212 RepID=A0A8K0JCI5_9HYPO|nr:hypothetical protein E4U42_002892 [Claviceps africana]